MTSVSSNDLNITRHKRWRVNFLVSFFQSSNLSTVFFIDQINLQNNLFHNFGRSNMKEVIEKIWLFCWSFDFESDQTKFNSYLLGLLIWFPTLNGEILLLGQTVWNIFDIFFQNICLVHCLISNYLNSSVNKCLLAFFGPNPTKYQDVGRWEGGQFRLGVANILL